MEKPKKENRKNKTSLNKKRAVRNPKPRRTTVRNPKIRKAKQTIHRKKKERTINDPVLERLWKEQFKYFPVPQRMAGDYRALDYAVTEYMEATQRYYKENLSKRINAWIRSWMSINKIDDKLFQSISYAIKGWKSKEKATDQKCKEKTPQKVLDFIKEQKTLLQTPASGITHMWIIKNLKTVINYFWKNLEFMEKFQDTRKFSIAPICKIHSRHITIDTSVLYFMMKQAALFTGNEPTFKALRSAQFDSIFKTKGLSSGQFCFMLDTDGVSASFHFEKKSKHRKPVTESEKEEEETTDDDLESEASSMEIDTSVNDMQMSDTRKYVIGIDPGRSNLIFAVEDGIDGRKKTHCLRRKSYYTWSGINKHKRKTSYWLEERQEIKEAEDLYCQHSTKTTCTETFDAFLQNYITVYDTIWSTRTSKKWRRSKLRVFSQKRKIIDRFFSNMRIPRQNVVVAYGGAKFSSTRRGERPAPVKLIRRACERHFRTINVKEDYTSQVCPKCGKLLGGVKEIKENGSVVLLRGLRRCWSTVCSQSFLKNRDRIAAENIKRCYEAGLKHRPLSLRRKTWKNVKKPPVTRIQFTEIDRRLPLSARFIVVW